MSSWREVRTNIKMKTWKSLSKSALNTQKLYLMQLKKCTSLSSFLSLTARNPNDKKI